MPEMEAGSLEGRNKFPSAHTCPGVQHLSLFLDDITFYYPSIFLRLKKQQYCAAHTALTDLNWHIMSRNYTGTTTTYISDNRV